MSAQKIVKPELPALRPSSLRIGLVALPWHLDRRGEHLGAGPEAILAAGLSGWLAGAGCAVDGPHTIELTEEERRRYGAWHKVGVHGAHLADAVMALRQRRSFPLALLGDCNGALGMIAGLQRAGARRLGMVWFDAHADFNTPETTLSGMLGGMPVAVAAGLCLQRLRQGAGIDPPLDTDRIVLVAARDIDPLEQDLVDEHRLVCVDTASLKGDRRQLHEVIERLIEACDAVYVHIDLDVLDPEDAPGMNLPVSGGPTADELAAAIELCLSFDRSAALGIASYNVWKDEQNRTLSGVYRVIAGAVRGLVAR
ncbi:MAG: arginase family protein [Dehalococcoidia bacterium]